MLEHIILDNMEPVNAFRCSCVLHKMTKKLKSTGQTFSYFSGTTCFKHPSKVLFYYLFFFYLPLVLFWPWLKEGDCNPAIIVIFLPFQITADHKVPVNVSASLWTFGHVCDQRCAASPAASLPLRACWVTPVEGTSCKCDSTFPSYRTEQWACRRSDGSPRMQRCWWNPDWEPAARWGHISGQKINTTQSRPCQGALNSPKPLCCWTERLLFLHAS